MSQLARHSCVRTLAVLLTLGAASTAQLLFGPSLVSEPAPAGPFVRCDVADVDGDAIPDLIESHNGSIRWHQGTGTGTFVAPFTVVAGVTGIEIHLVDLDGDGRKDLLAATAATATLMVAMAGPVSGFEAPVSYVSGPASVGSLLLTSGDSDADGDADVLVLTRAPLDTQGEARVFINDGTGALTVGPIVLGDATHLLTGGLIASVDGDALPDLVVVSAANGQPETTAWQGQPGGGVLASWREQGVDVTRAADLDMDGDVDLLAATHELSEPEIISTFLGDGTGDFVAGPVTDLQVNLFGVVHTNLADFDGDGPPDLVVAVPGSPVEAWMLHGDGSGGFAQPDARVTLLPGFGPSIGARAGPIADFDLDGRPDVSVVLNKTSTTEFAVALNETYANGGPLLDLGHQLEGFDGWPIQVASGSFAGGSAFSFSLEVGPPLSSAFHVVGWSTIFAPFKGGTMVPMPNLITGPWFVSGVGKLTIAGHWPQGVPPGFEIAAQFWFSASGTIAGYAASSGVLITTP